MDKEIEQSWTELKNMESILQKKRELKSKYDLNTDKSEKEANKVAPVSKRPTAPPLENEGEIQVDVHHNSKVRYTTRPINTGYKTSPASTGHSSANSK